MKIFRHICVKTLASIVSAWFFIRNNSNDNEELNL